MKISDILSTDVIAVNMDGADKEDAIKKIIDLAAKPGKILDLDKVSQKIQAAILSEKEAEKKKALMAQYKECNKLQEKLSKYELQEAMLGQRNSYSKTDPDATYMQLKDERGAPAYNVQISTSNQFIVHASMHQNTNDSVAFIPHIAAQSTRLEQLGFAQIAEVTADAG